MEEYGIDGIPADGIVESGVSPGHFQTDIDVIARFNGIYFAGLPTGDDHALSASGGKYFPAGIYHEPAAVDDVKIQMIRFTAADPDDSPAGRGIH